MFYLFELRDSDGNDCSVFDLIIEAPGVQAARERLEDAMRALYPNSEHDWDGSVWHPCNCSCDHQSIGACEECEPEWQDRECSHGGALVNADKTIDQYYRTYDDAREAGSIWHGAILFSADGSMS